jgi:exodeoxyribonuclease III
MALHKKADALASLEPDIAIIQECAQPEILHKKGFGLKPSASCWIGSNPNKGLAAFSFNRFALKRDDSFSDGHELFLPIIVSGPIHFNLLAVWAFNHRAKGAPKSNSHTRNAITRVSSKSHAALACPADNKGFCKVAFSPLA